MKRHWVAVALAPLTFASMAATYAHAADTTIGNATTTPVTTAGVGGNITISSSGSVKPTASGAAVTLNSNNSVSNAGTIAFSGVNDAQGILVEGGFTGNVTNSGTISLTEVTTGGGTNQGIAKGPFANGANRTGIDVLGLSAFNGSINNAGTITVIGENSAGIAIGTEVTGALTSSGTINVTGGTPTYGAGGVITNAGNISYGIHATGPIDGDVTIKGGGVSATGQNAVGVALRDVGGADGLAIQTQITTTGYRSATAPTDPKVLANLTADQLLQSGPALEIGGNIAHGVVIAASRAASGNVAAVTQGSLVSDSSAPALLIGGANAVTIGPGATGLSLNIGGNVLGQGLYRNVNATAIQIGGTNGLPVAASGVAPAGSFGAVSMAGGIEVDGTLSALALSDTSGHGDATALDIGANATIGGGNVTGLTVTGNVSAGINSAALLPGGNITTGTPETGVFGNTVPVRATAIKVDSGGSLSSLHNTGTIGVAVSGISTSFNFVAAGGTQGEAVAINDQSGTLSSVTNSGAIFATVSPIVSGQSVDAAHTNAVAMYLTAPTVSVLQTPFVAGNGTGNSSGNSSGNVTVVEPAIAGEIVFASTAAGAQSLDLETGTVLGNVTFDGTGSNSLTINGNATLTGGLAQAAGGSLAINVGNGTLAMTAPTANTRQGSQAPINVSDLTVGSKGEVIFTIDPTKNPQTVGPQFNVSGNATLVSGAKIGASLLSKLNTAETFTLISANNLTVGAGITGDVSTNGGFLPFLYKGTIVVNGNDLDLQISPKAAADLGLNPAQSAMYSSFFLQVEKDPLALADVLSKTNRSNFVHLYDQFLPDYAGGAFRSLTAAQRSLAQAEADPPVKLETNTTRGWVQEIGFLANRNTTSAANGYETTGFGLAGGVEHARGSGAVGISAAFVSSNVQNRTQTPDGTVSTLAFEAGAYWRQKFGGVNVSASVNGGYISMGSHRFLEDTNSAGTVVLLRNAESQWNGAVASGQIAVSYQKDIGRFFIRPEASADYVMLYEGGHRERGGAAPATTTGNVTTPGGDALDMVIHSRTSTEASAEADVVLGYTFGTAFQWRPEVTVGWRQIITGGPASTTAHFVSGGSLFTLSPDLSDRGGFLARLGLRAIGNYADIRADAGGEFRNGYETYDARAVARFLF